MQKISLKVLLRFLSSYTHWNLVRRAECYHLYFVTRDSVGLTQFPSTRWRHKEKKTRRRGSKLAKDSTSDIIPLIRKSRAMAVETPNPTKAGKDVFLFSPIFESPEQAVANGLGGLEQALGEGSKRSSLTSLVWDDECDFTAPYHKEGTGYDSESSYTTIGDSDSRESTPRRVEVEKSCMETSVQKQGDRLLKDMLQLRRDIEKDLKKEEPSGGDIVQEQLADVESSTPGLEVGHTPDAGHILPQQLGRAEENMLRERLEEMTLQIKQEMAEEIKKNKLNNPKQNSYVSSESFSVDETHVHNNGEEYLQGKANCSFEDMSVSSLASYSKSESSLSVGGGIPTTNGQAENFKNDNGHETESENIPHVSQLENKETTCQKIHKNHKTEQNKTSPNATDVPLETNSFNIPEIVRLEIDDEERVCKSKSPSVKVDTLNRKKKLEKSSDKPSIVEIPFCSHNQHSAGPDQASYLKSMERKKKPKPLLSTILSPADRLGAEEILHELIEIRDGKSTKEKDPVLDTMISVIQLSSTNLSLPAPTSGGGGVHFKELFDFEVNFSESREAFAKLAGEGKHTVQELFPWTTGNTHVKDSGVFKKLRPDIL